MEHWLKYIKRFTFSLFLLLLTLSRSGASENMIIIIIDGARYSETFGDMDYTYIPRMAELARQGTHVDHFFNDSLTYTSRAIPALWCGSWTEINRVTYNGSNTNSALKPTIFEYYRKHKNKPANDCYYVIKYLADLWLPSFDPDYGPDYWPIFHSSGSSDSDVAAEAEWVMDNKHPSLLLIYLADVDSKGHSGNWNAYTQAVQKADSIVGLIWQKAQADPVYKDKTTLFVTNDHGRHDDQHGGFKGHGDGCEGCRHIQFLALGPQIKSGFRSRESRRIPDMTVTAGALMGFETSRATGQVMSEILDPNAIVSESKPLYDFSLSDNYPNPFNPATTIRYSLLSSQNINLTVYDLLGKKIKTLASENKPAGQHAAVWDGTDQAGNYVTSGFYIYTLRAGQTVLSRRMLLIK